MRRFHIIAAFAVGAALAIAARTVDAQAGLREGLKVRLSFPAGPPVTGVIQSLAGDSIVLFVEPAATRVAVARGDVRSIEVSQGRLASAGAKKGALWGGAIFGVMGAIFAMGAGGESEVDGDGPGPGVMAVATMVQGAGMGALIGALVKSERWESVSVAPVVGTGATGFRVGVRIR